jgi:hypothetical protein
MIVRELTAGTALPPPAVVDEAASAAVAGAAMTSGSAAPPVAFVSEIEPAPSVVAALADVRDLWDDGRFFAPFLLLFIATGISIFPFFRRAVSGSIRFGT